MTYAIRAGRPALAALLCLAGLLSAVLPAAAEPLRLMAFGDSLVHGYGLPAGKTFPAQLEAALRAEGHDVEVLNAGNSGDTTASGRARLDWALGDEPDAVMVALGANDGLRGIDPRETYENLDAILRELKARGLPVLLVGMLAPRNLGPEYVAEFDAVYPRLAAEHQVPLYPFFLKDVAMDPELNQADGIHPNAAGVAVMVENILPHVEALIERAQSASGGAARAATKGSDG